MQADVGVDDHQRLVPLADLEVVQGLFQRARLAPVGVEVEHVDAAVAGDLDGTVLGGVGDHVDLPAGQELGDGLDRLLQHRLLVVGRDQGGHVGPGQRPVEHAAAGAGQRLAERLGVVQADRPAAQPRHHVRADTDRYPRPQALLRDGRGQRGGTADPDRGPPPGPAWRGGLVQPAQQAHGAPQRGLHADGEQGEGDESDVADAAATDGEPQRDRARADDRRDEDSDDPAEPLHSQPLLVPAPARCPTCVRRADRLSGHATPASRGSTHRPMASDRAGTVPSPNERVLPPSRHRHAPQA